MTPQEKILEEMKAFLARGLRFQLFFFQRHALYQFEVFSEDNGIVWKMIACERTVEGAWEKLKIQMARAVAEGKLGECRN